MKHIFAIASLVLARPVVAQEVPDYLGHLEQFEFAAKMITSIGLCENLGLVVDDDGVLTFAQDTVVDAVKDGIDVETAHRMSLRALRDEQSSLEYLQDQLQSRIITHDMQDEYFREYIEYWFRRCGELVKDDRSSDYYQLPELIE